MDETRTSNRPIEGLDFLFHIYLLMVDRRTKTTWRWVYISEANSHIICLYFHRRKNRNKNSLITEIST